MTNLNPTARATHAMNRFGLGYRLGETIPEEPVSWLMEQLEVPDPQATAGASLADCLSFVADFTEAETPGQHTLWQKRIVDFMFEEQGRALRHAITTPLPFRERLVLFWANHFAITVGSRHIATATAGNFVRTAIRPYVTDTFVNMLLAVIQHPAMLDSLDADISVGPQSPVGLQSRAGFNENLGRELLELHTVGLGANYTQADVDAMAYMLTGWTVNLVSPDMGFTINASEHQPGPQTLLGQTYPGLPTDAYEALRFLGTHPQTYLHIATELVTHFVSDTPEQSDIAVVADALSKTGGSLSAAAKAVVELQNAWVPLTKVRTPSDFVLATLRTLGVPGQMGGHAAAELAGLGQGVWESPFPNGWSDLACSWVSSAEMLMRINWAWNLTWNYTSLDPVAAAAGALGPLMSQTTANAIAGEKSTHDKLTLLFSSPEFQRR